MEKVIAALWITIGMPRESRLRITFRPMRKCFGWKSKRICARFLYSSRSAKKKLTAWPMTVASAAPRGPMPIGPTNRISSTTLMIEAIAMKMNGCFESPMPRRIALTRL